MTARTTDDTPSDEDRRGAHVPRKDGAMHLFMLALWVCTAVWFNPRLFALFANAHTPLAITTLALFILCVNVFWLFGNYYISIFVFSFLGHRQGLEPPRISDPAPQVAVLYLTRNDFKYDAARSCVELDYPTFHVFLLDDSTNAETVQAVDAFQREFSHRTTIVRRPDRRGFKAGSLNNALRQVAANYPYFAIIDADGVVPHDFLERLVPCFGLDDSIAFVQGSHRPNPRQDTTFAADLAPGILPLWTTYYPPRNKYGLVLFLGHGGVWRTSSWEDVGGFPEISAEDLAISTEARARGYQGWYVDDVVSLEDFPSSYRQLRGQQERYMKGGCEYLANGHLKPLLRSSEPAWFEKLDLVLWLSTLFLPILYLAFLIVYAVLMPISFSRSETLHMSLLGVHTSLWTVHPLSQPVNSVWTWDFYAVTLVNVFAPVLGSMRQIARHPIRTMRLLAQSCVPYLSLSIVSVAAVVTFMRSRQVDWNVTNERDGDQIVRGQMNVGHASPSVRCAEVVVGSLLMVALALTFNIALMVYALSLLLAPLLLSAHWDRLSVRVIVLIPYALLVVAMMSVGADIGGLQGAFHAFFPFHL